MPAATPRAVFLSYAREDTDAARRIADALRSHGVEVWFDQNELRGGDAWDAKIKKQIRECALFMPLISARTQERHEGYFRREWKLGVSRTHDMAAGVAFLVPVVVDGTPEKGADVPEEFMHVQWMRLPGALPTPQFVEQVKRLLDAPRKTARAVVAGVANPGLASARPEPLRRLPGWIWGAVAVIVLGAAAGWFVLRKPARPATEAKVADVSSIAAAKEDKSIAVLPFENLSDDKENTAFFSDGMHEDILTNLANIRELRVVSRTSVMQYRDTTKPIPQIARELGVAYILEGSVRRAGNTVRITGQLIHAANDEHFWAKAYDRELTPKDIFAIQAALSTEIAGALRAAISPQEKSLVERRPTDNLAAYDLFLKGRGVVTREILYTRAELTQAEQYFKEAVDLDPNFALAWAELADRHALYVFWDFDHTPARLAQADAAIGHALRLAPDAPDVLTRLGIYTYHGYRDYARAIVQFEKVIRLQPNNADAIFYLGNVQRRQGRWLESLGNMRKAIELDPGNAQYTGNLVGSFTAGRRWDDALAAQRRVIQLLPDRLEAQARLAEIAFAATGSTKEADDWLARLTPAQLESPRIMDARKFWANMKDNYPEWKRLDGIQPYFDEDGTPHWQQAANAAMVLAAQGDLAGARARLADFPAELRSALQLEPANAVLWRGLSVMDALLGQKEDALRDARKAVELLPETLDALEGKYSSSNLAVVYAWTGDKDRAIAEFARLFRVPVPAFDANVGYGVNVHGMRTDAAYAPLRGDPRFEALLSDPKNNAPLF